MIIDKNTGIRMIAQSLQEDIQELQSLLDERKALLSALGNICDHPDIEVYRDRQVGTCQACFHKFMSREEVDRIFRE